jgi:hypothetical protein
MADLQSLLDPIIDADPHAIPNPIMLEEIADLFVAQRRIDAAIDRRLQACEVRGITVSERGRCTRSWLVEELQVSSEEAGQRIRTGWAMINHPALGAALEAGAVSAEQARVIDLTLRKINPDSHQVVEANMITAAAKADPVALGSLGRSIRTMLDADDDVEAAAQRRYDSRWLVFNRTFRGMMHVEGMLDDEAAALLQAAITPLMDKAGAEDDRSAVQRRADALTELAAAALTHGDVPDHGGERPHIMVTIAWPELRDQITGAKTSNATLNGRFPVTPETARRIACDANIIPAVLGGDNEVLDLGRSTPTWNKAQRRARRITDRGCTFPDCQTGLDRCHIHHLNFVSHGGPTDLANGTHLCRFHHWLIHHTNWTIWRNNQGKIQVART